MDKSPDAFRTISEVAELLDTPAHVLRFWESRFPQIKPVKRAGGRRYYRPADVALLSGIRHLLHEEGMTIRGVQKILREQGVRHVAALGGNGFDDDPEAALDAALSETYPPPATGPVVEVEPETAQVFALATVLRGLDRPGDRLSPQLQLFETGDMAAPDKAPVADNGVVPDTVAEDPPPYTETPYTEDESTPSEIAPLDEVVADFSDAELVDTSDAPVEADEASSPSPDASDLSWGEETTETLVDMVAYDASETGAPDPWQQPDTPMPDAAPEPVHHLVGDAWAAGAPAGASDDLPEVQHPDAAYLIDDAPLNIFGDDAAAPAAPMDDSPDEPDAGPPVIYASELIARMRALPREILIENAGDAAHVHDRLTRLRDRVAAAARGR